MSGKPLATDDVIQVPIPPLLAARFVSDEAFMMFDKRALQTLRLGSHDLGTWRIDAIGTDHTSGYPRMLATLRRCHP